MDLDPDEIDIQLRSPRDVGRRMIALSCVSHLLALRLDESEVAAVDDDELIDDDDHGDAGERFDWRTWLEQEELLAALSPVERTLLESAPSNEDLGGAERETVAGEALGALAWTVRRSELTVLDRGYPYLDLLDLVPSPWNDPAPFLSALTLRPEEDLATAREAAEILSWRAQVEVERRQATGSDLTDIEEAIRDVAIEAAASGVASVGIDGDISVGGTSIGALPDPIIHSMVAAARSRLRAMNWLCGLGDWDDPTLTDI